MIRILQGDCRELLATLADASVHCALTSPPYWGLRSYLDDDHADKQSEMGLEPSPTEHVAALVNVCREVRRVLRPEGTLWLNVGDCYATSANGRSAADTKSAGNDDRTYRDKPFDTAKAAKLKSGNLCLIPERLAIALQADGWIVRSRIIWGKTNTKPDSSGRWRPSYNHEMIWMLSKQMPCFYDSVAVRQKSAVSTDARLSQDVEAQTGSYRQPGKINGAFKAVGSIGDRLLRSYEQEIEPDQVWKFGTAAFSGAHTATFPPELAERCIRAGTSEFGVCDQCAAPWIRQTTKGEPDTEHQRACGGDALGAYAGVATKDYAATGAVNASDLKRRVLEGMRAIITTGWTPTCVCERNIPTPATVLDFFGGAGTTGVVADRLGRDAILMELNAEYVEIARSRFIKDAGMFANIAPTPGDPA